MLSLSGYDLPWESSGEGWDYPSSFAPPLQVAIEASDGASDYGNKFGEPVLSGKGIRWSTDAFKMNHPCIFLYIVDVSFLCFVIAMSNRPTHSSDATVGFICCWFFCIPLCCW